MLLSSQILLFSYLFVTLTKVFQFFLKKFYFSFFFKNNNGLLFQDFLELSERLRVLEEKEKDRAKSSLVQSTETNQSVNNKVRLYKKMKLQQFVCKKCLGKFFQRIQWINYFVISSSV